MLTPGGLKRKSILVLLAALAVACSKPDSESKPVPVAEDAAPAAPAAAAPSNDAALNECLASALQLVESARLETAGFGDKVVNLTTQGAEEQARLVRWRSWVPQWKSRVESAKACLPPPAPATEALYMWANGGYEMLADPPNPGAGAFVNGPDSEPYLPSRSAREAWLNAAKSRFEKAQSFVGHVAKPRADL